MTTTILFRPVGGAEQALVEASGWRAFPLRLPEQPIFYPVDSEACAHQIARDRNAKHNADGLGFVTRFAVRTDFLTAYERKVVGGLEHEEYRIPAEDLPAFNAAIEGLIETVAAYTGPEGRRYDVREFPE